MTTPTHRLITRADRVGNSSTRGSLAGKCANLARASYPTLCVKSRKEGMLVAPAPLCAALTKNLNTPLGNARNERDEKTMRYATDADIHLSEVMACVNGGVRNFPRQIPSQPDKRLTNENVDIRFNTTRQQTVCSLCCQGRFVGEPDNSSGFSTTPSSSHRTSRLHQSGLEVWGLTLEETLKCSKAAIQKRPARRIRSGNQNLRSGRSRFDLRSIGNPLVDGNWRPKLNQGRTRRRPSAMALICILNVVRCFSSY